MSRPRPTADPAHPAGRREHDALSTGGAWDLDDESVAPLDDDRAPLGTHEIPPAEQTRVASPGARQRTPAPRHPRASSPPPPAPRRTERAEDRVGAVLGSYRLLELIGKGGMGFVYRAEHIKLGREVALKVLRLDYAKRRDSVARFFQEARTVNRIRHRNIIDVTDFIELDDGTTFIIMEMLRGKSLGRWAKTELDEARSLALLIQICDGLAAAHAVGVIHRDLKPDNVIVVPTGDGAELVKLLDFGVAKLVHRDDEDFGLETAAGSVIGTPAYMSPEQAGGLLVDARSDIYSLGAIMYELFCGVPMFRGRSFGEYVRKHLNELPVAPRDTAGGATIDPRLEDIVLRCLEKDPARRYPAIEALRDDLLATLAGIETLSPGHRSMPLPAPMDSGVGPMPTPLSMLRSLPPTFIPAPRAPTPEPAPEPTLLAVAGTPRRTPYVVVGTALAVIATGAYVIAGRGAATPAPAAIAPQPPPVASARPQQGPAGPASKGTLHPLVDIRFDTTPAATVLAAATTTALCTTPCTITIDPNDGGRTDSRAFTLHRDGFRDRTVEISLAHPPRDIDVSLARIAVPRITTTRAHAAAAPITAAAAPPPPPPAPPPHRKGKVDATETIDPFHR